MYTDTTHYKPLQLSTGTISNDKTVLSGVVIILFVVGTPNSPNHRHWLHRLCINAHIY